MPGRGIMSEDRFQVLCYEQVDRLDRVMRETVPIHGRGNFPTLNVKLKEFVQIVKNKLKCLGILVRDIRLNGGAASYILGSESNLVFNDYDLIFNVQLKDQSDLQKIKDLVLSSLLDFFPKGVNKDRMSLCSLNEAYVNKMVKIFNDADKWSLISLSSVRAKNIELKFADSMRRQFEFSVDSFQIILDSLLTFYEIPHPTMTEHFYPTVDAESVYGNFEVALYHLNHKLIATRNPEEIRGGGLLKYCNLLVRGYMSSDDMDIRLLEKYMCSRFFIDFSNITDQRTKLENYLAAHFTSEEDMLKVNYLKILHFVVSESTICLMGHERRQTLELIDEMIRREIVSGQRALSKRSAKHSEQQSSTAYQTKSNLIIDQVFYGPFSYAMPGVDPSHQYYTVYNYDVNKQNSMCPLCEACPECG